MDWKKILEAKPSPIVIAAFSENLALIKAMGIFNSFPEVETVWITFHRTKKIYYITNYSQPLYKKISIKTINRTELKNLSYD